MPTKFITPMYNFLKFLWASAKRPRAAALACLTLVPWSAMALEVGMLHWKPMPGLASFAIIDLSETGPIDPNAIRVSIATQEAYAAAGLTYPPGLANAKVNAQAGNKNSTVLRLDHLPPNITALDLLLVVSHRTSLSLAQYRLDLRPDPHDVGPSPLGTHYAAAPPVKAVAKPIRPLPTGPVGNDPAMVAAHTAVLAWAQAWSERQVDTYINAYTPDYAGTQAKGNRQTWIQQRRSHIEARKTISVELKNMALTHQDDTVTAAFEQRYRSDGPNDRVRKRLVLISVSGRWLIQRETTLQ